MIDVSPRWRRSTGSRCELAKWATLSCGSRSCISAYCYCCTSIAKYASSKSFRCCFGLRSSLPEGVSNLSPKPSRSGFDPLHYLCYKMYASPDTDKQARVFQPPIPNKQDHLSSPAPTTQTPDFDQRRAPNYISAEAYCTVARQSEMAGNSTTAVPLRYDLAKEIEKLLSIWSKLKGNDKQNCKKLIDSKIRLLQDCSRPRYEPTYDFMESVLSLKSKLVVAKFDLGSIELVISKEMEDLMNKNGLQYSGGAEVRICTWSSVCLHAL